MCVILVQAFILSSIVMTVVFANNNNLFKGFLLAMLYICSWAVAVSAADVSTHFYTSNGKICAINAG